MKIDKPSRLPMIKCAKCGHMAPPADFKEVKTRTIYCPECGAAHAIREDRQPRTITCVKCKSTCAASRFTETPPASKPGPDGDPDDAPTNTSLGGDAGRMYRPGALCLQRDEGGWQGAKREFELVRGRNTLGRQSPASQSTVQFTTSDSYMSKNHATVEVAMKHDSTFEHILSDNGSTNGTFHNDTRLSPGDELILTPGDTVRMGRTTFIFVAK